MKSWSEEQKHCFVKDFLNQITDKNIILNNETSKYRIIGLPFFNKGEQKLFIEEFTKQFEKLL